MRNILKSTLLLTISTILTRVIAMLFMVILARTMTVSDYGAFKYLISISMIFSIGFSGFTTALSKYIGEDKEDRNKVIEYVSNTLILTSIFLVIILLSIHLSLPDSFYLNLLLFASFIDFFYIGFIRGILNYVKLAGFKLVENSIQLLILLISYFLHKQITFSFAIIFYSLSPIISLFIFEFAKPELIFRFKASINILSKLAIYAVTVSIGSIGWTLMFSINTIFIKHFYSNEYVGYYSIGVTFSQIFLFLPSALNTIILPKVSGIKDKSKIIKPITLAASFNMLLSLFGLLFLVLFKKYLLLWIFGEKYLPGLSVIIPLAIGQIFISTLSIYSAVWQGLGKPIFPTINICMAAIINTIGSYYLTQKYGIYGASISTAISSFFAMVSITTIFYLKRKSFV